VGRACGTYGEERSVYRVFVGKPEGRRALGILRRKWKVNCKLFIKFYDGVLIGLVWLIKTNVNSVVKITVP
jgi:hypothetical protein